jgi:dihydroxyacetone kinase-like predicted kinase
MPAALAALVVYDPEADADVNLEEMTESAESVATGEITRAVRDAMSDSGAITEGDWIGLVRGDGIVSVSDSLETSACALLDYLITPDREIVTVITGADATADHTDALLSWIAKNRPNVQVEVHRGGQPLYPYLFGVE